MRKLAVFFLLMNFAVLCPAQQTNPFAGSRWQGRVSYRDPGNRFRIDNYELVLAANGTCIVTVRTRQNGKDLFQDTDGNWSFDANFFRLECDFPDGEIEDLPYIQWASAYQLDDTNSRFTLLIKPYPNAGTTVKTAFVRIDD